MQTVIFFFNFELVSLLIRIPWSMYLDHYFLSFFVLLTFSCFVFLYKILIYSWIVLFSDLLFNQTPPPLSSRTNSRGSSVSLPPSLLLFFIDHHSLHLVIFLVYFFIKVVKCLEKRKIKLNYMTCQSAR